MSNVTFDASKIKPFRPFKHGSIVFGGFFGDEGKGKIVDIYARKYKEKGLKILSVRGQGSGNAGHTVKVDGKSYDFHYLTSAGLSADIMLLGAGMLIDPIRMLKEAEQLPAEMQKRIMVDERATIVCNLERTMDAWYENQRTKNGKVAIGTTKSGVGPGVANRALRTHITFADALKCIDMFAFRDLILSSPFWPEEVKLRLPLEHVAWLWDAIHELNVVDSTKLYQKCREERDWAVLLEVSQAVCLDPLFGNGGHFVTSTRTTDIGAAASAGLTLKDFPDGSTMVLKAYGSKVGGGPYITKFSNEESEIANFIYDMVGEKGVTTGRKRDLGWFDGPAVRHSIDLSSNPDICVNCIDVIAKLKAVTNTLKICYAYENKVTGEVEYGWPYHLDDYKPIYMEIDITGKKTEDIISVYIEKIQEVIGKRVRYIGTGPSNNDLARIF